MNYYKIYFTLDSKVRGNRDYIKDYELKIPPTNLFFWENPQFIGNIFNQKVNFEPYLLEIELFKNSKINDLIMEGGPIATKLIVSSKLKLILENNRKTGMQFFNINVVREKEIYNNYWILNMYEINQEFIDYKNSIIKYEKKADDYESSFNTKLILLDINTLKEFNKYKEIAEKNLEIIEIERLALNTISINEDFFALKYVEGGIGYFVSETLKQEIEKSGCIGLEFQPSYLSLNEWLINEREKIYGKI
ncbi:hypothetical protein EIH07_08075 [Chryseobacterium taklimakanense]|uniref:imm11 family protein n=1 Tax=Chryseobacterium taklimakanense TaxID=536441 RepID=UPI000F5F9A02|nr:DUF1629 domain-containing protein [Chryseobacterium taklimakanense]AZI22995.1 hypothetical protein EIH07_08075 [Chryseobacterium taklimakanense]